MSEIAFSLMGQFHHLCSIVYKNINKKVIRFIFYALDVRISDKKNDLEACQEIKFKYLKAVMKFF